MRDQVEPYGGQNQASRLKIEMPDELLVLGNEQLLGRAVSNLIDNAVKYAAGDIDVSASEREGQAVLQVRDRGPGVADELRDRIFEPFFRNPEIRGVRPGHGLGLPLARAVARAHGGDVMIAPNPAQGAVFELSLPLYTSA